MAWVHRFQKEVPLGTKEKNVLASSVSSLGYFLFVVEYEIDIFGLRHSVKYWEKRKDEFDNKLQLNK